MMSKTATQKNVMPASMGVDIGTQSVKFVLVDQSATRVEIKGAASYPMEAGQIEAGVIRDPKKWGKEFSSKIQEYNPANAEVVVSVPSNLAVLRWVALPMLEGDELRDAARFKVKRHLPFPVESAYVEASVPTPVPGEEGTGQSLVIALKRELIDSRAEALEFAGLKVVGAELEAQAILRVVERKLSEQSALWRDASLTIIDIGANNTHMYVVQNQQLQFIRGVKFGAIKLSEAVAREFNCTVEHAESLIANSDTLLTSEGILHLKVGDLPAMVNVQVEIEKLTKEFLRLLRYFRSLHPERSYAGILDHVLVCGGFAGVTGFAEYLQTILGLRVERAKPFAGMVGKFNRDTFESIASRQEAFTVSVGLALSGLSGRDQITGDNSARREYTWARSA
jgi:type IV pilus assembly protein PilM